MNKTNLNSSHFFTQFELLNCSNGAKGKSFIFCPYCNSFPPFPDMKKGMASCSQCTHPTCVHSQNSLGVSSCVECEGTYLLLIIYFILFSFHISFMIKLFLILFYTGVLVLDPCSKPKWKLGRIAI